MAVEARHPNLFSPQLLMEANANANLYNNAQMGYYNNMPLSGTTTVTDYANAVNIQGIADPVSNHQATKCETSGLTACNINSLPPTRKRSRHVFDPPLSYVSSNLDSNKTHTGLSFLGQDLSFQLQQQQFHIDQLISQHMEKVKMEIEEKRKKQARMLMEAIEIGMLKRLKAKEEEIEKIGKLNWALEEKVKSLYIENQIWKDLAQTNEATANALRSNLEQVLLSNSNNKDGINCDEEEEVQSCCGSSTDVEGGCTLASGVVAQDSRDVKNRCRNCLEEESSVLVLPCRHLCLCTLCVSTVHTCPVCKVNKTASVHVNLS